MAKTSVRVTSDSSSFQQEMKKAVQSMKELSSETSLATTQAKLFGSAQDALKAKISGLQAQISQQADIVKLNKDRQQELVQQLDKWKSKQSELQSRIQATKAAIEQSTAATGENSDETKALKDELAQLTKEEKDAAAQVSKTEERLSKQTVATNKSEQALVELQGELKKTNKELKDAAWDEWTKKADKATQVMDNVGQKLMVVTGAVVGMGAAAVKTTADFDAEMSTVQSISGATGDDFDALREKALEMGSTTAFSASEAASAMEYMAMAGWSTEDMLDGIAGVMNAAAASGEDLAATSDILTDGLTAFGLAASDSAHFADVLVAAGNNANTSVAMMGETFKYAGAVCGTLGITVEDCAIATGLMGNAGIKASQAGTALRSGLSKLIDPTTEAAKAMEQYGFNIATTEDGSVDFMGTMQNLRSAMGDLDATTQAQALSTIFGTEAMSGWAAIVSASDEDFQNLTNAIYDCEGAAQAAADVKLDNLSGQITILKSTIEGIAIQIGDILMPTIRNVVARIQEWAAAFAAADEDTKKTILTVAGVVAAIGPLILGVSKVIKTVKNVVNAFKLMKTGLTAVKAALAGVSAPVLAVVAVVAALVAAFMHLWNTNEGFRTTIIGIWNEIKNTVGGFIEGLKERLGGMGITFESVSAAIKTVWNALCEFLAPVFEGAFQHISNTLTAVTNHILGVVDFFIALFKGDWEGCWEAVKGIFANAWEYAKNTFSNWVTTIRGVADVILGWFGTDWNTVWTSISTFFVNLWNNIKNFFVGLWNGIVTTITGILNTISSIFTSAWNGIKNTISTVWNTISTIVSTAVNTVKSVISTVWNGIKTVTSSVWAGIKALVTGDINGVKSAVSTAVNAVKTTVSSVWNSIKSATSSTWNAIKTAISTPINSAINVVKSAIDKIKGFFNFSWSLPKLAMPHPYISGKFSLNPPQVPKFGISWYKTGAIMDGDTIFGMNGNTLLGGGEAGKEAILPLEPFYVRLGNMLDTKLAQLTDAVQNVVVYVTCLIDGEEITTRQIVKVEKYLAGSSRAIRRATT